MGKKHIGWVMLARIGNLAVFHKLVEILDDGDVLKDLVGSHRTACGIRINPTYHRPVVVLDTESKPLYTCKRNGCA